MEVFSKSRMLYDGGVLQFNTDHKQETPGLPFCGYFWFLFPQQVDTRTAVELTLSILRMQWLQSPVHPCGSSDEVQTERILFLDTWVASVELVCSAIDGKTWPDSTMPPDGCLGLLLEYLIQIAVSSCTTIAL